MRQVDRTRGLRRPAPATVGAMVVFAAAGALFATSAQTARGTQLRADRTDLATLIRSENARHDAVVARLGVLRAQLDAQTAAEAAVDSEVAALREQAGLLAPGAGLAPVTGPGLVVTLDDAPHSGTRPAGASPDDLVVHQQDVQAVVNALWAGGAEAMMLMDQRVISTSAVRCVGNTLILQGRVYSPPYTISAIGDVTAMRAAMDSSPQIPLYLQYVQHFGLGWQVEQKQLSLPAFSGSLQLRYAAPVTGGSTSASPSASTAGSAGSARPPVSPSGSVTSTP
jgi:uncharacterized protein YlxW (UPF0749 family)